MKQRYYCRARDADSEGLFVEGFRMNHRSVMIQKPMFLYKKNGTF